MVHHSHGQRFDHSKNAQAYGTHSPGRASRLAEADAFAPLNFKATTQTANPQAAGLKIGQPPKKALLPAARLRRRFRRFADIGGLRPVVGASLFPRLVTR